MRLLLLGPKYNEKSSFGGVIVAFELFLKELDASSVKYVVIDTNKDAYSNKLIAITKIYILFLSRLPQSDHVSLHGTANDYKYIAPLVVFFSKLFRKRVSLRKFAGNFITYYQCSSIFVKWIIRCSLKNADALFFETKYLVNHFNYLNNNTCWMPNSRSLSIKQSRNHFFQNRYVFLGHVRKEKGVVEIIEAANRLPENCQVDIYGHVFDHDLVESIANSRATYKGVLNQIWFVKL